MSERVGNSSEFERRDPELEAISNQLTALSAELGFVETPAVSQAREAFLRGVPHGGFDLNNLDHRALLDAFHEAAERTVTNESESIGYQIAVARLWLEADDPERFYELLDLGGETGIVEMIHQTPGCDVYAAKLYAILDELEALNG